MTHWVMSWLIESYAGSLLLLNCYMALCMSKRNMKKQGTKNHGYCQVEPSLLFSTNLMCFLLDIFLCTIFDFMAQTGKHVCYKNEHKTKQENLCCQICMSTRPLVSKHKCFVWIKKREMYINNFKILNEKKNTLKQRYLLAY